MRINFLGVILSKVHIMPKYHHNSYCSTANCLIKNFHTFIGYVQGARSPAEKFH